MEIIKDLLTELSQSLKVEILDYYQRFYSYTLHLLQHKNIDIGHSIFRNNEKKNIKIVNSIVETIASALNSIGILSTSIVFKDNLSKEFLLLSNNEIRDYKELFEIVGKKTINIHLFNIIFEYIIDIDTQKLDNLDLFDLLPENFKTKLNELKKTLYFQDRDKFKVKSLYPSIGKLFNPTSLKINDEINSNNELDVDILKKLHDAKEKNIEALKNPILQDIRQNFLVEEQKDSMETSELSYKSLNGDYYYDLFGNLPTLNREIIKLVKIDFDNLISIAKNPEFLDLESLFYYISIYKLFGLQVPLKTEEIIKILTRYISGKIFSTGMYHISNPLSNFFGLSIVSELNLINDIEIIDLLDIEMFLENELKLYLPQKLYLNYFTLMSLRILEKWGVILTEKKHLVSEQINYKQIKKDEKSLPLDLFCQLSLIKLLDDKTDLTLFKELYKDDLKLLISKKGLVNDNLTDSARVLLIFKMLGINYKDDLSINILLNSLISNSEVFQEQNKINNFHWSNDVCALKVELRMTFWMLIALLEHEHILETIN